MTEDVGKAPSRWLPMVRVALLRGGRRSEATSLPYLDVNRTLPALSS